MSLKALILDRDGVINKDCEYLYKLKDLKILPGVITGLKKFQQAGYLLIVITNQSGIGRGYYAQEDYQKFNNELLRQLKAQGIKISQVYACFHKPEDNCSCRKPKDKMLIESLSDFNLKLNNCLVVGDKDTDFFNFRSNFKTAWIKNKKYPHRLITDFEVKDLDELANIILK